MFLLTPDHGTHYALRDNLAIILAVRACSWIALGGLDRIMPGKIALVKSPRRLEVQDAGSEIVMYPKYHASKRQ